MSTHIYGRLEEQNVDGEWEEIDGSFECTINYVLIFPNKRRSLISKRRRKVQTRFKTRFFDFHGYSVYGWLADVRNYSGVPPLKPERITVKGMHPYDDGFYSNHDEPATHEIDSLPAKQLIEFDYNQLVEDRRYNTRTLEPGKGKTSTYRTFLGTEWMLNVKFLKNHPNCRLVFWFD